jgi:hypothetical protein
MYLPACSSVESSLQSLVTGEERDETYGGRQHFPVSPDEAVRCLTEIAPQHGWEVVSTGDEYDVHGRRGTFFRLETNKSAESKKSINGIFYSEPRGTYVHISEKNGLPEDLVDPLIAAIKAQKGYH